MTLHYFQQLFLARFPQQLHVWPLDGHSDFPYTKLPIVTSCSTADVSISHTPSCPFLHSIPPVISGHNILFQNTAILLDEMQNTKVGFVYHPTGDIGGWPRSAFILLSGICTASMGSSQLAQHSVYLEIPYVKTIHTSSPNYVLVVLLFRLQVSSRCCCTPFVQSIRFSCKFSIGHFKKIY